MLYICNIAMYNIVLKMQALILQRTHLWKYLDIPFHGLRLSVLEQTIFGTCL